MLLNEGANVMNKETTYAFNFDNETMALGAMKSLEWFCESLKVQFKQPWKVIESARGWKVKARIYNTDGTI